MSRVHLLIGPVGAGKSTFALRLAEQRRALWFDLDDWMATLFRADRPESGLAEWYGERAARCVDQIWQVTAAALALGTEVVLEIGLVRRLPRMAFYDRVDDAGVPMTVYLIDAPRDVRRARVARRNIEQGPSFSMVVPPAIFEMASDLWQPPDDAEICARDMRCLPLGA